MSLVMYPLVAWLAAIEIGGFLGFVLLSRYPATEAVRHLPLAVVVAAVIWVVARNRRRLSYREILLVSLAVSAIFVAVHQALAFTAFSGLAKDVGFLSTDHLGGLSTMMATGAIGHALLLGAARFMRR